MNVFALAENLELAVEEIFGLMKLFYEQSLSDLETLERACQRRAQGKAAEAARSIKCGAINLGLQGIHKMAKEMETLARQNQMKELRKKIPSLKEKFDQLGQSILNRSLRIP